MIGSGALDEPAQGDCYRSKGRGECVECHISQTRVAWFLIDVTVMSFVHYCI